VRFKTTDPRQSTILPVDFKAKQRLFTVCDLLRAVKELENICCVFLLNISRHLLAFYHEWYFLIGYAAHYLLKK